ncbi:hypothetical protein EST38_g6203 [Candolleomyces aberdarensis]|uniref:DUF659 domain-containing protein n=1 Tax=Candolleomyces aberdarensis TaxID=2316362 RepID=A0A4V1Q3S9_9AGAR|nr:hypothetical protein EST38_g6203 [Candolleomyces aberdarensis]
MDYADPHLIPKQRIKNVLLPRMRLLINHLPDQLPEKKNAESKYASFLSFALDPDILEKTGCEVATLGEQMEGVFGWKARTEGDGIIPIDERGPALAALVDVLEEFFERHSANNVLKKWIVDILKGLEKVFALHGTQIPLVSQPESVAPSVHNNELTASAKRPRSETLEAAGVQPQSKSKKKKGPRVIYQTKVNAEPGRHADKITSTLVIRFKYVDSSEGFAWKCIAPTCTYEAEGNVAKPRVLKHAATCKKLREWNSDLFMDAVRASKSQALSAQVPSSAEAGSSSAASASADVPLAPISSSASTPTLIKEPNKLPVEAFKAAGRKRFAEEKRIQQLSIDKDVMLFLCVHGITPSVVDSPFWKKIMRRIPGYNPTPATTFKDSYIPQEANWVRDQQLQLLKGTRNLTLTFDGTTIRKPHSFYTTHATTPQREVFFLGGHGDRVTPERHTATWISDRLMEDIEEVGKGNWVAACSDNTNVTKASRRVTVGHVPTMFDLNDSIHHIHGTIQAVTKIDHFKEMITLLRAMLKHFKKSPLSVKYVREEWAKTSSEPFKSFKSVAKTRFDTMYVSACSVKPYLAIVRSLVAKKKITFKLVLDQYIDIVEPMIRALWCLESAFANPSDVYAFWLAIGATLKKLFRLAVDEGGVPIAVANEGHPLLQEIGSWSALQEFKEQLPQFWNRIGIWLIADSVKDENPLEWWESMGSNMYGRVLAIPDGPDFAKLHNGKSTAKYRPVVKFSCLDENALKRLSGEDSESDKVAGKQPDVAGEEELIVLDPLVSRDDSDSESDSEAVDPSPRGTGSLVFFDDTEKREEFQVDGVIDLNAVDLLTFLSSKLSAADIHAAKNAENSSGNAETRLVGSGTDARRPRKAQASDWEDD